MAKQSSKLNSFTTCGHWFGPDTRPLLGWMTTPATGATDSGVLILPAIGYSLATAHRTLRRVAECLALEGHSVMRCDYEGTGDSSGDQWEEDRLDRWSASVSAAAAELRSIGCRKLTLVGVQFGGTLALAKAVELEADRVVLWNPALNGRRLVRELRLFSTEVDAEGEREMPRETVLSAGNVFRRETLAAISEEDVPAANGGGSPEVILVQGTAHAQSTAEKLRGAGWQVTIAPAEDSAKALEQPAEYAVVPPEVLAAICEGVGRADSPAQLTFEARASARFEWEGTYLEETVVTVGDQGMVGVRTLPADGADGRRTVVFLNSGSESHIGPGRAWVEYARGLAARGHVCLRVDFLGWGESPDQGGAPGRPYDESSEQDTADIVRTLTSEGREAVLVGLCAGAWPALRLLPQESVAAVIAFGAELFWERGFPVARRPEERIAVREPFRRREELGRKLGVWSILDAIGIRPWAGRWLDEIDRSGRPALLIFAPDDVALRYIRDRIGRRMRRTQRAGRIRLVVVDGLDHAMHRSWKRGVVLDAMAAFLDEHRSADKARPVEPLAAAGSAHPEGDTSAAGRLI